MLYELVEKYASLSIIGMCKNAGKTTVLNRLIAEAAGRRRLALTSIGRDGESVDVVTHTHKPGIYVLDGTLVATAAELIRACNITREIVGTLGINTPLGEVVIMRAMSDGDVQLAGPSMTAQLTRLSREFSVLGADMVLIDGAISRKTLCAPAVSEATVLCTGASYNKSISVVVEDTAFAAALLTLPVRPVWSGITEGGAKLMLMDAAGNVRAAADTLSDTLKDKANEDVTDIFVNGALTDAMLTPALMGGARLADVSFTVQDGSKLLMSRGTYEKLLVRGARLCVLRSTELAAISINPVSAYGFDFDADELLTRMRAAVDVPVLNVGRGFA